MRITAIVENLNIFGSQRRQIARFSRSAQRMTNFKRKVFSSIAPLQSIDVCQCFLVDFSEFPDVVRLNLPRLPQCATSSRRNFVAFYDVILSEMFATASNFGQADGDALTHTPLSKCIIVCKNAISPEYGYSQRTRRGPFNAMTLSFHYIDIENPDIPTQHGSRTNVGNVRCRTYNFNITKKQQQQNTRELFNVYLKVYYILIDTNNCRSNNFKIGTFNHTRHYQRGRLFKKYY